MRMKSRAAHPDLASARTHLPGAAVFARWIMTSFHRTFFSAYVTPTLARAVERSSKKVAGWKLIQPAGLGFKIWAGWFPASFGRPMSLSLNFVTRYLMHYRGNIVENPIFIYS
jgi:hypothetical protein